MILRIKLLQLIYDPKTIQFLLLNLNNYIVDYIGSYLCNGYTLDQKTYNVIHNNYNSVCNFNLFSIKVENILNKFQYFNTTFDKLNHCEYLFRFINIYCLKITKWAEINNTHLNFIYTIKNKIIELKKNCCSMLLKEPYIITHNINTRLNNYKQRLRNDFYRHIDKFNRESNECLYYLNNFLYIHHGTLWI